MIEEFGNMGALNLQLKALFGPVAADFPPGGSLVS